MPHPYLYRAAVLAASAFRLGMAVANRRHGLRGGLKSAHHGEIFAVALGLGSVQVIGQRWQMRFRRLRLWAW